MQDVTTLVIDDVDDGEAALKGLPVASQNTMIERLPAGGWIEGRAVEHHCRSSLARIDTDNAGIELPQIRVRVVEPIRHVFSERTNNGSGTPAAANPRARNTQLSQCSQGRPDGSGS